VSTSIDGVIARPVGGHRRKLRVCRDGARSGNGASALSTASFTNGEMILGQMSGTGETTYSDNYDSQVSIPLSDERTVIFSGQIGESWLVPDQPRQRAGLRTGLWHALMFHSQMDRSALASV